MVIAPYTRTEWEQVEVLSQTDRGEGGFGSTGTK
jgi:dUTP pyrophosphatase